MEFNRTAGIFGFLALAAMLFAGFLLHASGLTADDLLSFSLGDKTAKVTSLPFFLFLVFLPLVAGLISATPYVLEKKQAFASVLGGTLLGMLLAVLLFSNLSVFLWPAVFFWIGSALAIETIFVKKQELKSWVKLRLAFGSVQRQMSLVAIGLIVFAAATILPQQEKFSQQFEEKIMNMGLSPTGANSLNDSLSGQVVDLTVQTQQATIQQIMQLEQFSALKDSGAPQDQAFVVAMQSIQTTVDSPAYKDELKQQLQKKPQRPLSGKQLFAKIKEQVPILKTTEEWLWLIFSIGLASIFLLVAGIILQPIGVIWGVLLQALVDSSLLREKQRPPFVPPSVKSEPPPLAKVSSRIWP